MPDAVTTTKRESGARTGADAPPSGGSEENAPDASAPGGTEIDLNRSPEEVLAEELAAEEQPEIEDQFTEGDDDDEHAEPEAEAETDDDDEPDEDPDAGDPDDAEAEDEDDDPEADPDEGDEAEEEEEGDDEAEEEGDDDDGAKAKSKKTTLDGKELPPWAKKRIENQSATVAKLREQVAQGTVLQATPDMPLADLKTAEEVDAAAAQARRVVEWCEANPEGGDAPMAGGGTLTLSAEERDAKLAQAKAVLGAEKAQKERIASRERTKPWEAGEELAPGLLTDDGNANNRFLQAILRDHPEIVKLPDWELIVGAAARGMRMRVEEQSGVAKYVRVELDPKTGKAKTPAKSKGATKTKKPAPKRAPSQPGDQRPPQKAGAAGGKRNVEKAFSRAAADPNEANVRDLLAAEMA